MEQTAQPQSRRLLRDQTQSTEDSDTEFVDGEPPRQTSSTPSVTPVDLSWALSPLPEGPDLSWELAGGELQHLMNVDHNSSMSDDGPCAQDFSSRTSFNAKNFPHSLDFDNEVNSDLADVSCPLDSNHLSGSYLHQPDPLFVSPSLMTVSGMSNSSHSFLPTSKQASKSFPNDVSGAQLLHRVEPLARSQPAKSAAKFASILDSPKPSGKNSLLVSGPSHRHTSRVHSSPAVAFVAPNVTPVSPTSEISTFSKSSSARSGGNSDSGSMCQCVTMMLKILENMGIQGLGTNAQDNHAGFDVILSSLGRGMNLTEQVLACSQCNACTENGMLLATIAQQLGNTAASVTTFLASKETRYEAQDYTHWRQNRRFSTHGPRPSEMRAIEASGSALDPSNNNDPAQSASDLLEITIFFGRYKVINPEIQLQLMNYAMFLHISQLQKLLVRIKDRMGSNRGAWKLVMTTGTEVRKLWDLLQTKVSQ